MHQRKQASLIFWPPGPVCRQIVYKQSQQILPHLTRSSPKFLTCYGWFQGVFTGEPRVASLQITSGSSKRWWLLASPSTSGINSWQELKISWDCRSRKVWCCGEAVLDPRFWKEVGKPILWPQLLRYLPAKKWNEVHLTKSLEKDSLRSQPFVQQLGECFNEHLVTF